MNKLLISYCIEFEAGWGQRPDGFMIGETKELMLEHIEESNKTGSKEYFWRYEEPTEIHCNYDTYSIIKEKMGEKGVAHFENRDKNNLNLFTKI